MKFIEEKNRKNKISKHETCSKLIKLMKQALPCSFFASKNFNCYKQHLPCIRNNMILNNYDDKTHRFPMQKRLKIVHEEFPRQYLNSIALKITRFMNTNGFKRFCIHILFFIIITKNTNKTTNKLQLRANKWLATE